MKRIFISEKIIELSEDFAKNLFSKRRRNFEKPLVKLGNLKNELQSANKVDYVNYVKKIIDKYSEINKIKQQNFDSFDNTHFQFPNVQLDSKPLANKQEFYKLIVEAMRYEDARAEFLPYARKLGIKVCVYCNAQLAVTIGNDDNSLRGLYELDHFYPKSHYPYLCTSFFNLQPVCANCNKSKNDNKAMFSLYTTDYNEINLFKFQLSNKSLIKYMLNQNHNELEIDFDCTDINLKQDHEKHFHITELYKTQRDLAEEIVWKSKIYNESYQAILKKSFSKLFLKRSDFNRLIIGNYDKTEDIHKRPMAKFVQDIAKQLGVLRDNND